MGGWDFDLGRMGGGVVKSVYQVLMGIASDCKSTRNIISICILYEVHDNAFLVSVYNFKIENMSAFDNSSSNPAVVLES